MTEQEKDDTVLGCFAIFMVIVFLVMFAAYVAVADAHEWYPAACCSDLDCRPVPCEEIHSVGDKWEWHHFSIEKRRHSHLSPTEWISSHGTGRQSRSLQQAAGYHSWASATAT